MAERSTRLTFRLPLRKIVPPAGTVCGGQKSVSRCLGPFAPCFGDVKHQRADFSVLTMRRRTIKLLAAREPLPLDVPRRFPSRPECRRWFAEPIITELLVVDARYFHMNIDAIQQRTGNPLLILRDGGRPDRIPTIPTRSRIHLAISKKYPQLHLLLPCSIKAHLL